MEPTKTPRVLSGRYELSHLVARGGMAEVYRAHDQLLDRPVALKVLFPELSVDRSFVERFRREAQAAANLSHPNIVPVFDWGEDSGTYFIVMEFVDGRALSSILRTAGPLHPDRAAEIAADVAGALSYAHRHGVVHRDVKPGNLLRAREGDVKLADFGIAKATEQSSITQVGSVLGTAAYLAPEQARGEEAGPRADLYALGVVAYQLISGRLPYEATSLTELALKQQREEPAKLDTLVAAAGPELADAVAIALALDPRDRYETAREMGRAISDGSRGIPPVEPAAGAGGGQATQATSLLATRGPGAGRTAAHTAAVTPRQPRPGPAPRRPAPVPAPVRSNRGTRRLFGVLFALVALAVIIAATVVITAPSPTKIVLRNVVYSDVNQAASSLKELVGENTK
jgi:eukaryotic-like serine/threonine-protein kinase